MVIGHSYAPTYIVSFICLFHMPLFFLCSGYCFKQEYRANRFLYLKKRIQRLYVPFVKYTYIFMLLHFVFCKTGVFHANGLKCQYDSFMFFDYLKTLFDVLLKMVEPEHLLGGFWFLNILFVVSVVFFVFSFCSHSDRGLYILFILSIVMYILCAFWRVSFLWFGKLCFLSCAFYALGILLKQLRIKRSILLFFFFFLSCIAFSSKYPYSMQSSMMLMVIPYVVFATFGFLMMVEVSLYIDKYLKKIKAALAFVGSHTLDILIYHLLTMKLASLLFIYIYKLDRTHLSDYPTIKMEPIHSWGWLIYTLFGVAIPILYVFLKEKTTINLKHIGSKSCKRI